MIHRCAWCGKETTAEDGVAPVGAVSDGICEDCRERFFPGVSAGDPRAARLNLGGEA
ncbi:MAG: hypothetical protein WC683_19450 [bacterium]